MKKSEEWAERISNMIAPYLEPGGTQPCFISTVEAIREEYAKSLSIPLESSRPQSQWQELQQQLSSLQKENEELRKTCDAYRESVRGQQSRAEKSEKEVTSKNQQMVILHGWVKQDQAALESLRSDVKPLLKWMDVNGWHTAVYTDFLLKHPEFK